jgi:hypothetical protein
MFALYRQACSLATRFVFGIAAMLVVTLACALVFQTAKAQVRFGIGVGGIGGVLLDDTLRRQQNQNPNSETRRQQNQNANSESNRTKKAAKTRNQNHRKEDIKTAKGSPPDGKSPTEKPPIVSAPQTAPLTASTPASVGTRPTAGDFGD